MPAPLHAPGHVLPGTVYRVVRHLATGGMGSVYEVEDVTVEKRYVLKTLHPDLVAREDLAARMRDEARSLARLQHPNIVGVVTAGVTTGTPPMPFYVMERLVGQNLRVVLEKAGALHPAHAYRIAIDVADALEHAHEHELVHRDVKPENVFLHRNANGTTTTKLLDFGIVRLLDRKESNTHGRFVGTLRYASPEQITGGKIGPATDIYSLGAMLFEMLCGRGPFDDAGDGYAIGTAHARAPAPPLSRFLRGVTPDLERLVACALSKRPDERPRDCFAFASELRRILHDEEASPRSATVANLLTSAAPETEGEAPPTFSTGPTIRGAAPSAGAGDPGASQELEGGAAATMREGSVPSEAPVSPIAPTVAADGPISPPASPAGPEPASTPAQPPPRAVDREAPTRASAPLDPRRGSAQNDTQMVASVLGAGLDGASADRREVTLGMPAGALGLAARSESTTTGPIARDARRAERGPVFLVGGAIGLAVVMIGGALLAIQRPWEHPASADAPSVVTASASLAASAAAPPPEPEPEPELAVAKESPRVEVAVAKVELDAGAGASAAADAGDPPPPSSAAPVLRAAPRQKPPRTPGAPKDVPFDP